MRLKHIEVLHAIMVSGSLSGAARLLNVSQPAVTQTLQHAELQLGYPLFKRVRNRLIPTQEALALYGEVDKLFAQLESVRTLARNLKESAEFELRMLVPPSHSSHVLPLALKRFRKKYKSLALDIRTLHSRDIISAIAMREADVGVVYGTHPHPAVEDQLLATGHLMCLKPGAARGRTTLPLTELAKEPMIRIHHQDPIGFVLNDLASRLGVEFVAGITVQTYQAALSLAKHGFSPTLDHIAQSGSITLGHRESSIPFSYLNGTQPVGFAMDLCMRIVDAVKTRTKRADLKINYQPVTSLNRIPLIQNGSIDLECGSTTNNSVRQQQVAFTLNHFYTGTRRSRAGIPASPRCPISKARPLRPRRAPRTSR